MDVTQEMRRLGYSYIPASVFRQMELDDVITSLSVAVEALDDRKDEIEAERLPSLLWYASEISHIVQKRLARKNQRMV